MTRTWLPLKTNLWTLSLPLLIMLWLLHAVDAPQRLNFWLYDALITAYPAEISEDIALVAIDENSLGALGQWPWPRNLHAQLITRLSAAGAETIVFDVLFPEPSEGDAELAAAMEQHGRVILPVHLAPPATNQLLSQYTPTPLLAEAAHAIGHAHVELDEDGLARGVYLRNGLGEKLWPSLALAASGRADQFQSDAGSGVALYTNTRRFYRAVPLAGSAGTVDTYSYIDILTLPASTKLLEGKTVFVGATAPGFGDILPTPFSGLRQPMSGVEFHANTYSALTRGALITRAPLAVSLALAALVIAVLAMMLPRIRPGRTLYFCLGLTVVLVAMKTVLLLAGHLWLSIAHALLASILAMPVSSALRLAMTNGFLNRQLDELAMSPSLSLPQPSKRHPTQLMAQIQSLLKPEGWLIAEGDNTLSAQDIELDNAPELPNVGEWVHRSNESWIRLERFGVRYVMALKLPHDLRREAIQRYLQRLVLTDFPLNQKYQRSRENISARIERVRKATHQMGQMQMFIRRSFESMPDGIIVTDELGVIRFANDHIEEWFGEPMPSLNGLPLVRLLDGHDPRESPSWHETVSETLTLSQLRTVDLQLRDKDFLIHFAPFALPDSDQKGIIANISDISELREQQRQHREAIDFISHDVRSPLVSQLALIEQLKRNRGQIEMEQLDQLSKLAKRSYHLAEEFVQLARAEQLTETRFYECEFLAITENARDSVSEQAAEKGIQLVLQGQEDLWLKGNAELLERAVINLLTNAVQYSPPGSTVTIQAYSAGHEACLTVSDEGEGIAAEELPYLFDRFRRQKSSELSGNRGTGLGLSFVDVVVEKHKGRIFVDSQPGEGSVFHLKLPMLARLP